ncbi:MAG: ATP-binding cassette domain-containing protein [Oscillospiraceae bacterium]|nr:ATP-binding cassette domain-containing protein [Oscillospiraceae bacterium]
MSLTVSHLRKTYGSSVVVDDLSFEMTHPGVYALLGTNGAGKTTSLRMMLDMLAKDSGTVTWNGKPLSTQTCNIGYLAEERGLYPKYALMDQLIYFAALRGVSRTEAKKRIQYWARRLEVEEYLYQKSAPAPALGQKSKGFSFGGSRTKKEKPRLADQLSKGNQQKIQIMIALLSDPELIVLDEPLSGLDPVNTDIIRNIIHEEIDSGKYLIMSSHQMATVEEFCTDLTILSRSKTVLQGNLNEIKKSRGRINLALKVEQDITQYINASGVRVVSEKEHEYQLKVDGDEQANRLLRMLTEAGIPIVTFSLREPSLHELFVEKVGETHESE